MKHNSAKLEVFMVIKIQVIVFWVVTPPCDEAGYQCFRWLCCLF